eukprot:212091-Amphidinium_carterae.1
MRWERRVCGCQWIGSGPIANRRFGLVLSLRIGKFCVGWKDEPMVRLAGIVKQTPYTAQTVLEAELQAVVEVLEFAEGPIGIFTDCQAVQLLFQGQ